MEKERILVMNKSRMIYAKSGFGMHALALLAGLTVLLILSSCASVSTPPPAEMTSSSIYREGVPGGVYVNTLTVSARVTAIDTASRRVKLMGPDGNTFVVKAGPEVVNFDQIGVGDQINVIVTEELIVYLNEEGASPRDGSAAVVALAAKGAKPGGLVAETTQRTAKVTSIDSKQRTATLRFEDDSTKTFPVRSDVDLSNRKVGEQVVMRLTEMIAISVEKP